MSAEIDSSKAAQMYPEPVIINTERHWLYIAAGMLGVMLAVVVVTGIAQASHPISDVEVIDPATLHRVGEFMEGNLGPNLEPDGSVTVRMIAEQYNFAPRCVAIPANTPVCFRLTSPDVTHGFIIADTNTNAMVVPGFISEVHARFQRLGDYKMPCHEFCGFGHQGMWAQVRVVSPETFRSLGPEERLSCGSR